jgi:hypothetical protein
MLAQCYKYFVPTGLSEDISSPRLTETVKTAAAGECNLLEVLQNKNL